MGMSYCEKFLFEGWYKNNEHNQRVCNYEDLKYNLSWDWLMPVIDEIFNLCLDEQENNELGDITHALVDINIQKTHEAVVKFLKSYSKI